MKIGFELCQRGNTAVSDSMDEPGGHYVKLNKAGTEEQILHSVYVSYLK